MDTQDERGRQLAASPIRIGDAVLLTRMAKDEIPAWHLVVKDGNGMVLLINLRTCEVAASYNNVDHFNESLPRQQVRDMVRKEHTKLLLTYPPS